MIFKRKEKEIKKERKTNKQEIHIVIKRNMGRTPEIVGEFDAVQERDDNFNFVAVNEDYNFKEEIDFSKQKIIEFMKYKLGLKDMKKSEKTKELDKNIKYIDEKLKELKNGKVKDDDKLPDRIKMGNKESDEHGYVRVNKIDLENEKTNLQVIKYAVENEGEGSYEIINAEGKRQLEFCVSEGVLYPYFHRTNVDDNGNTLTTYPDITTRRKFYKESSNEAIEDYLKSQEDTLFTGIKGIIIIICVVALFVSGAILHVRVNTRGQEIDNTIEQAIAPYREIANQNSILCAVYYTRLLEDELINRSLFIPPDETNTTDTRPPTHSIVDISQNILGR